MLSIQDYYSGFLVLWSEYDEIKFSAVFEALLSELLSLQQNGHRDQLLMKLRPEYETVRSNLMSRASLPTIDDCLQELLREEQRLVTKITIEQQSSTEAPLAYAVKTRPPPQDISRVQCYNCKKYSHYANHCKLRVCKYCKAVGHTIEECRKKARNSASRPYVQSAPSAYTATTPHYASSKFSGSLPFDSTSLPGSSSQTQSPAPLTPAMVNQMIINALSSMNISSTSPSISNTWYLDSGAII